MNIIIQRIVFVQGDPIRSLSMEILVHIFLHEEGMNAAIQLFTLFPDHS